ncbi:MAG: serine hydrolase [Candidatus Acidiferrales bacterium]
MEKGKWAGYMRWVVVGIAVLLSAASIAFAQSGDEKPRGEAMMGYTPGRAAAQRKLEAGYAAIPSAAEARKHHRFFTAEPHPAGSERNNELARHIAEVWKQQGLEDVKIHRYDVLSSYPREVSVEMVAPVGYKASLREDAYDVDPDTKNPRVSSGYLGFSASGEVTAPVVYAHSGNPEHYALLARHGIDVRGKIVLVRYSNPYSYRGFKALTAERMGAAAILIYSDPKEDGYTRGKVFPDGPWGPESHIQRGAITYDFLVAGDPLTPGWAALPDAKRIPIGEARSVPKIIAVPLSWRDARPLLENMDGPEAPKEWQGGLPIKYRLGGERVRVHLKVDMDTSVTPNYVVEGRIRGSELPDEWVILGNHRDAWEFGGVDPSSGTASMMEVTRALGELKKQGVRPRRTMVVCSWDGEEVALTGSTEWGEHFADELKRKAVAYLNVDSSVSGPDLNGSAVASLAPVLEEVTRVLQAPTGNTLYEDWKKSREESDTDGTRASVQGGAAGQLVDVRIGSGSDHTVFLNHLGIPTVGLGFDGPYGVYHSMYDNHYWISKFGDPGFKYHRAMAQLWGVLALRLANADVLPFDFAFYGETLRQFVRDLEKANPAMKGKLDLAPLQRATVDFQTAGRALKHEVEKRLARDGGLGAADLAAVNAAAMAVERNWLHSDGIPGRPWFKHLLYAARYTYAHLELPGLTEAVEAGKWDVAQEQAALLQAATERNTGLLTEVMRNLEGSISSAAAPSGTEALAKLRVEIEAVRGSFPGDMAVYMKNLTTGEEIAADADTVYETFSVIKVPIMAEVFRQAAAGKLSLSDRVTLQASDARLPSGVLHTMEPGLNPTIRDLLTLMIIISDNSATDMLADRVGRANVTRFMNDLGLKRTSIEFSDLDYDRVWLGFLDPRFRTETAEGIMQFPFEKYSGAEVSEAFRKAMYESDIYFGHSTAREMGRLFAMLARGELVSKSASEQMLSILRKQRVNDRFPRYLRGVDMAHKTGDGQPYIANDAGILWVKGQAIVLVVFTGRHRGSRSDLHDAIARIAAYVGRHYGAALAADFNER